MSRRFVPTRSLPLIATVLVLAACGGEASKYSGNWSRDLYGEGEVKMSLASNGNVELMLPSPRWPDSVDMKGRAAFVGDTLLFKADTAGSKCQTADARYVVKVPAGIDPVDAAPLTCAGVTTYKAVKVAHIVPAERVAVFGIGGLGHLAVQYAKLVGGFVTAVDVTDEKLELAHRLGADHLVNAAKVDVPQVIQAEGGADVAIVLAATSEVFEQAFRSLRRGGRLICVGLPKDGGFRLPIFETVLKGISVIGSIVGTRQDLREVFALHAAGRTEVVTEVRDLADVATAMQEVLAGKVPARIVFAFAG